MHSSFFLFKITTTEQFHFPNLDQKQHFHENLIFHKMTTQLNRSLTKPYLIVAVFNSLIPTFASLLVSIFGINRE